MAKHQGMVERLTRQLTAKGVDQPRETAVQHLQDHGILHKGTEVLTKKGVARTKMGPAGRAKDRAAKQSGHDPKEYKYVAGRAILK